MKNQSVLVLLFQLVLVAMVVVPLVLGALAVKGMIEDFEQKVVERTTVTVPR